jgi:hypothetical protein
VTAILDAIDTALAHYDDHLGSPWPGRIPHHREFLDALFGPEDGYPVPSRTDMEVARIDASRGIAAMREECPKVGCRGFAEDHEKRLGLEWGYRTLGAWPHASYFTTLPPLLGEPPWLAEEDAWLADRAAREAATA